jgi:UrcA family protein
MNRTAPILALATALALAAAVRSAAAEPLRLYDGNSHDPGQIVTYTRIPLPRADAQTAAGARALLDRIETAADAVCGGEVHGRPSPKDFEACRSDAVEGAIRTLGIPAIRKALAEQRQDARLAAN